MSDESRALVPIDERTVDFYGDELTAVLIQEGDRQEIYVPIRPIVEYLGLAWSGQYERLQRDAILSEEMRFVRVTRTNLGGNPNLIALPLKFLPGFLFGVNANRVKEELRERILRYQRECYDALWDAFQEGRLTAEPGFSELMEGDSPAAVAYRMAAAVMRLARQQLLLEARQEQVEGRVEDHERRLEVIEVTLGNPDRLITPAQATRISQAVKAVAMELGKQTKRNEYGGVYGELYRRFDVPGYKELPAAKFDEAMSWLTDWWQQLTGSDDVPF